MPTTNTGTGGVSLLLLEDVMTYCANFFERGGYKSNFTIANGTLSGVSFLQPGQYYRIVGSVFNDGLHQFGNDTDTLTDETFYGDIYPLAPTRAFLALAASIAAWRGKHEAAARSPYTSEGFGPYSYSKSSGKAGDNGWQAQFALELSRYRKL